MKYPNLMIVLLMLALFSCKKEDPPTISSGPIEGHWKWVAYKEFGELQRTEIDTLGGLKFTMDDSMIYHCKYFDSSFEGMKWVMDNEFTVWGYDTIQGGVWEYSAEFTGELCLIDEDNNMTHYFDRYTQAELDVVKAWGCFP